MLQHDWLDGLRFAARNRGAIAGVVLVNPLLPASPAVEAALARQQQRRASDNASNDSKPARALAWKQFKDSLLGPLPAASGSDTGIDQVGTDAIHRGCAQTTITLRFLGLSPSLLLLSSFSPPSLLLLSSFSPPLSSLILRLFAARRCHDHAGVPVHLVAPGIPCRTEAAITRVVSPGHDGALPSVPPQHLSFPRPMLGTRCNWAECSSFRGRLLATFGVRRAATAPCPPLLPTLILVQLAPCVLPDSLPVQWFNWTFAARWAAVNIGYEVSISNQH